MWLAVSGKKPLQAQYVCMTCVSNDDRATRAAFQQTHAAQDRSDVLLIAAGKLLRNPSENELARCIGLLRPIDGKKVYDVAIVGARL